MGREGSGRPGRSVKEELVSKNEETRMGGYARGRGWWERKGIQRGWW